MRSTWDGRFAERRKHPRTRILWSAMIAQGRRLYSCVIMDVSLGGLKIRLSNDLLLTSAPVKISCAKLGIVGGIVAWQQGVLVGVKLDQPPSPTLMREANRASDPTAPRSV